MLSANQQMLVGPYVYGWTRLAFPGYDLSAGWDSSTTYGKAGTAHGADSHIYQGVAVMGFAAIEGNVSQNANARFGDAIPHKIQR